MRYVGNDGAARPLRVLAPAKVNIFLRVLSRRSDGYHDILSLVSPVSLFDRLTIDGRSDGMVVVDDDRGILPRDKGNTVFRAATLLKERFSVGQGVSVFIEKRIPVSSGLGGPSSDAAAVLKALVGRWGLPVDEGAMMSMGKEIGADVPLFLYGGPCLIAGIGEKVTPVSLPPLWLVIVYPGVGLSTKEVYGALNLLTKGENEVTFSAKLETIQDVASILRNDLESAGLSMCPAVKLAKDGLAAAGAVGTLMSGSGSSAFGLFESEGAALRAAETVRHMGDVFVVRSLPPLDGGWTDGYYEREGVPGE